MRGKFKKVVAFLTSAIVLSVSSVVAFPASATGTLTTNVDLKETSFSRKWSTAWNFDCGIFTGTMTVGYDTFLTNEDYVEGFSTLASNMHYAGVKNSNNQIAYTGRASAGSPTGKADVVHNSSPVTYYAFWDVPQ